MKKRLFRISAVILLILSISLTPSCKKDKPTPPIITTTAASAITQTTASSGGNITSDGGAAITARGVCWSTTTGPTTALSTKTTDNTGIGIFTSSITALTAGTVYYVKAYATNGAGTAYGNEISFTTTAATIPILTTTVASAITQITATSGGNVTSDGGATVTAHGVCWSTTTGPTIALSSRTTDVTGTGTFISVLAGLTGGTVYYVRAYASNITGTAYGNEISFTTAATVPVLTTTAASSITQTTATSGGNVTSDGGASVTAKGVCWNISAGATVANSKTSDGTGTGIFTSSIASLTAGRVYYVRAYATNSVGTAYGSSILFTTQISEIIFNPGLNYGTVTDIDGNVYKTITIGTQTWMAENLKTTRFNNGDAISLKSNASSWYYYKSQPNYCWNNNDETTYKAAYGALYNEITISRGAICPSGWHVPYDVDWTTLTSYLGGESVAGGKLKETGTTHWLSPNSGATNESGFSALPGGLRLPQGDYLNIGEMGEWYSIMDDYRSLDYRNSSIIKPYIDPNAWAFSVRCIKY